MRILGCNLGFYKHTLGIVILLLSSSLQLWSIWLKFAGKADNKREFMVRVSLCWAYLKYMAGGLMHCGAMELRNKDEDYMAEKRWWLR